MKKHLYAVKDKKAKIYDGFMILENQAQAVRAFAQACEKNEVFQKWPEDFEVYELGEINTELGLITAEEPKLLASALSFVEKKENGNNTKKNNK